ASVVSLLTALYFKALRPDDVVAVKAHAAPAFYAIQYLRGRLPEAVLAELRSFGGLQAYPSRRKNPEVVDISTGSMGLGAGPATPRPLRQARGRATRATARGDAERRVSAVAAPARRGREEGARHRSRRQGRRDARPPPRPRGRRRGRRARRRSGRPRPRGDPRRVRRGGGGARAAERHPRPHGQGLEATLRRRSAEPHDAPDLGPDRRAARLARDRAGRGVGGTGT